MSGTQDELKGPEGSAAAVDIPGPPHEDGLNNDMLYGEGAEEPAKSTSGDVPGQVADGQAGQDDAQAGLDGDEPEKPAAVKAPAKASGKDGEGEGWDRARQERDQQRAAEVRETRTMVEALVEQNRLLAEQIAELAKGPQKNAAAEAAAEEVRELEALTQQVETLGEESDPEEIARSLKAMGKTVARLARRPAGGETGEGRELREKVKQLEESLRQGEARRQQEEGERELGEDCAVMDRKYGAQHRATAIAAARERLKGEGYSAEQPPTRAEARMALEIAYLEASKKAGPAGGKAKGSGRPGSGDPGGGGAPGRGAKTGSLTDVLADMRREGRVG